MRWQNGITDSMDTSLSKLREMVKDREAWHVTVIVSPRVEHDLVTEQQQQSELLVFFFFSFKQTAEEVLREIYHFLNINN